MNSNGRKTQRANLSSLAGAFENAKPIHADNDTLALDSGYASLVPCKIDVTDYDFLAQLKNQLKVES